MASVTQIARQCGVNRMRVHRLVKAWDTDYFNQHVKQSGKNRSLDIDDEGASRLAHELKPFLKAGSRLESDGLNNGQTRTNIDNQADVIEVYKERVQDLKGMLEAKDVEIESLRVQVKELTAALIEATKKKTIVDRIRGLFVLPPGDLR